MASEPITPERPDPTEAQESDDLADGLSDHEATGWRLMSVGDYLAALNRED